MKLEDVEKALKEAAYEHLTEEELDSFFERRLDKITKMRADAHLKMCLICAKQLDLLKQESEASSSYQASPEHAALLRKALRESEGGAGWSTAGEAQPGRATVFRKPWDRFEDYLSEAETAWRAAFRELRPAYREGSGSREIWRWESKDGGLKAWAAFERKTDLTINVSSNKLELEGTRVRVSLGSATKEIALERTSEEEVSARWVIPKEEQPKEEYPEDFAHFSMEIAEAA
jgi:hypothetical protein